MNPSPNRKELLAERDQIILNSSGRGLSEQELASLKSGNNLLSRRNDIRGNIDRILQGDTGESIGLVSNNISISPQISNPNAALQALARVDLPAIQAEMSAMTGYTPTNLPTTTSLYSNPNSSSTEAEVKINAIQYLGHDPKLEKMLFQTYGIHSVNALHCNVDFFKANPDEARGVCFHELGHVWSSKIMGLKEGRSSTFMEAFGELFRSAAAINENAKWIEATGCSGYDVLYGSDVPNLVIPHRQEQLVSKQLYNAGRFLVCNRLIEHLGKLDEKTLHGLSKALDIGQLPNDGGSLEEALRAIESETEKIGFADAVLNDPVLKFGGMKEGPVAIGLPSAGGDSYRIECFRILNVGEKWGQSRQDFSEATTGNMNVDNNSFHFEGVQTEVIPFEICLFCKKEDITFSFTVTRGTLCLTPEQILDLGVKAKTGLPAGEYSITVNVLGESPKEIGTKINISNSFRKRFQKERGIKFPS